MPQKIYRPSKLRKSLDIAFKGFVIGTLLFGVGVTAVTVFSLLKHYIRDRPNINRQRREYAEAVLAKEKREKQLGLRD